MLLTIYSVSRPVWSGNPHASASPNQFPMAHFHPHHQQHFLFQRKYHQPHFDSLMENAIESIIMQLPHQLRHQHQHQHQHQHPHQRQLQLQRLLSQIGLMEKHIMREMLCYTKVWFISVY